jgi:hypothetical protein
MHSTLGSNVLSVVVPMRGVLLSVSETPLLAAGSTANLAFDVMYNSSSTGSTISGLGAVAASSGAVGTSVTYSPSSIQYINPGDVLIVVNQSASIGSFTFAVKEF